MSQTITIDKDVLMRGVAKVVAVFILGVFLVIGSLAIGHWFKQQWLSLQPPIIATIDTQKLLSEKAAQLKEKMANAQTDEEQKVILAELSGYGDRIAQWVKTRAPELCGCLEQSRSLSEARDDKGHLIEIPSVKVCSGHCIVLNQQSVVAGNTVDLTQQFLSEQKP